MNQYKIRLRSIPVASYQNNDYEAYRLYHTISRRAVLLDAFREYPQREVVIYGTCKGTSLFWMKSIEKFQCKEYSRN